MCKIFWNGERSQTGGLRPRRTGSLMMPVRKIPGGIAPRFCGGVDFDV